MEKIKIEQHGFTAFSWFAGWLFTIGFLHLPFWPGPLGGGPLAVLHRLGGERARAKLSFTEVELSEKIQSHSEFAT